MPSVLQGRIVACFCEADGRVERARSLVARLSPLGAVHVGWEGRALSFAFEPELLASVLEASIADDAARSGRGELEGRSPSNANDASSSKNHPWAIGLAYGDLTTIDGGDSALLRSGLLWSGRPLALASALARAAKPGDVLCEPSVPALRDGLLTFGHRVVREGTLRVRSARLDARHAWKAEAVLNLTRMIEPAWAQGRPPAIEIVPGALVLVRADPGAGGTRLLTEIVSRVPRALLVTPVGSGFEPLGALRYALRRSMGPEDIASQLKPALDALLAGNGTTLDLAARLITTLLRQAGRGAIVIDDAKAIDPATLEACVRAVRQSSRFGLVARLDITSGLPSVLATLPKVRELELTLLSREASELIAGACTGGALDATARRRWGRLGGGSPLGVVEAVAHGIAAGEIVWSEARGAQRSEPSTVGGLGGRSPPNEVTQASARSRIAGRGPVKPAAKWVRQRASSEDMPARALLSLLAVIGGEADVVLLVRVLELVGLSIDIADVVTRLARGGWLVIHESSRGVVSVAFPSRTHRTSLFGTLEDGTRRKLHAAVARVLAEESGVFARVEGAWHAVQAGEGTEASPALLDGARAAAASGLETSTTQLIAFARRADPSCEDVALELLGDALDRAPSSIFPPPPPSSSLSFAPTSLPLASLHPQSSRSGGAPIPASRPSPPPPPHEASSSGERRLAAPPVPRDLVPEANDEPDSLIEHAVMIAPRPAPEESTVGDHEARHAAASEPDSMIEHARIVPPTVDSLRATDSEPPTMNQGKVQAGTSEPPDSGAEPTLTNEVGPANEVPPPIVNEADFVSMPPPAGLVTHEARAPEGRAGGSGSQIAARLGELAKDALLAADNAALERWALGLQATGEAPAFTERMQAMVRLNRGDIGDALRVLRRARAQLDPQDHRRRCQTSLALGVALNVAGRPQEALLEGLDALARARQIGDARGARACLAFLAKLYSSVSRDDVAARLREASP